MNTLDKWAAQRQRICEVTTAASAMLAALKGMEDGGCYAACKHYGLGKEHSAACADAHAAIIQAEAAGITAEQGDTP